MWLGELSGPGEPAGLRLAGGMSVQHSDQDLGAILTPSNPSGLVPSEPRHAFSRAQNHRETRGHASLLSARISRDRSRIPYPWLEILAAGQPEGVTLIRPGNDEGRRLTIRVPHKVRGKESANVHAKELWKIGSAFARTRIPRDLHLTLSQRSPPLHCPQTKLQPVQRDERRWRTGIATSRKRNSGCSRPSNRGGELYSRQPRLSPEVGRPLLVQIPSPQHNVGKSRQHGYFKICLLRVRYCRHP